MNLWQLVGFLVVAALGALATRGASPEMLFRAGAAVLALNFLVYMAGTILMLVRTAAV